jgi:hypothetical protein
MKTPTVIDNRTNDRFISLRTALSNADTRGYQVLTATLGTNGTGGQTAAAEDLLADGLEGYDPATFTDAEFRQHCKDAGIEGDGNPEDFLAYDRHQLDQGGYLTGLIDRVYVDLIS